MRAFFYRLGRHAFLLVAALTALVSTAQAQFNTSTNSDGSLTITGYTGSGGAVTIPSTILVSGVNVPVTSIGSAAFASKFTLTSVIIPSGVTSIGTNAFNNCSGLTSATIPDGVAIIGSSAFNNCSKLASITLPSGLTSIADSTFTSCSNLTSVTIPSSVTSIGSNAFSSCSKLASITLPSGLTSIADSTFTSCSNLTSVTLPSGVTSIGNYTFQGCVKLASINLPDGLASIGADGFYSCTALAGITIPTSVISIGSDALSNCTSLSGITVSAGNPAYSSVGGVLYNQDQTTLIQYPSGNLASSFTVPNGVTSIGFDAFNHASTNLVSINLPDTLISIGANAFSGTVLTSITIPNTVTSIGASAFNGTKLTSVTIPSSVTSIGAQAFYNCSNLTSITVSASNPAYSSVAGVLFDQSQSTLIQYPVGNLATSYTVPSGVTSIANSAFQDAFNLISVTIPASVTSIGTQTFEGCINLASFTIPNPSSLNSIGVQAFDSCGKLATINFPYGLASIGTQAFASCTKLTGFTVPSSVTSIGSAAFTGTPTFLPVIVSSPVSASVTAGTNGTFTVLAYGSPGPTYQWQISTDGGTTWQNVSNGNFYSGVTTATLTVLNVTASLSGDQYRAVLTNSKGTATTTSAGITVPLSSPTIIVSLPANSSYVVGGNAIIGVSASGNPLPTYQWQVSTDGGVTWNNLSDNSVYSGSATASLTIHSVPFSMSGYQYQAILTNSQGTITTTVDTLTVTSALMTSGSFQYTTNSDSSAVTLARYIGTGGAVVIPDTLPVNGVDVPVTSIGIGALGNNHAVTSIVIPNGVTSIGIQAFRDCENITIVTIGSGVTSIGFEAFNMCFALNSITVDPANTAYTSDATGVLFDKAQTTLIQYPMGNPATSYTIPNGVTTIAKEAFLFSVNLTSITLPDSVTTIADDAFARCSNLTSINIPAGVTSIGINVFVGCGLTSPAIVSAPARAVVVTGVNATFTVANSGSPTPNYQWQVSTDGGHTWNNVSGSAYSGSTTSTLTINNVTAALLGYQYRAVLTNVIGTTTTVPVPLLVGSSAAKLAWLQNNFSSGQLGSPAMVGDLAMPAGDGITNILKYAFNLNPTVNGQSSLPQATIVDDNLVLIFQTLQSDLIYSVEASSDLVNWSADGVTVQTNGNQVTASYPLPTSGAAYMHVVVSPGP